MNTEVIIPREKTFKLNPGHFRSKIQSVTFKKAKGSKKQNCCINFEAQVPGMERYECCARAVFSLDLQPDSPLRNFLEGLLGSQFFSERSGLPIDLDKVLRDKDCEIDVIHGPHDEEKFDWPMVLVQGAGPATAPKPEKQEGDTVTK